MTSIQAREGCTGGGSVTAPDLHQPARNLAGDVRPRTSGKFAGSILLRFVINCSWIGSHSC